MLHCLKRIYVHLLLLIVLLLHLSSHGFSWSMKKLQIKTDKFVVEYATPEYVDVIGTVTDDGAVQVYYKAKNKPMADVHISISAYHMNGNVYEKVEIPGIEPTQDFCEIMKSDMPMVKSMIDMFKPKPTSCPWGPGVYNITYKPDGGMLPPIIPPGAYKLKMEYTNNKGTKYYCHSWYGTLFK